MPARKRITPPNHGITDEAREALRIQGLADSLPEPEDAISSENVSVLLDPELPSDGTAPQLFIGEPEFIEPEIPAEAESATNAADAIDAMATAEPAIVPTDDEDEPLNKGFGRRRRKNTTDPKVSAPNLDEWMDFFSRIVIRFMTEWYVEMVFRGVDDDAISDRDAGRLLLTDEERDTIARPFAEYANKNPFMKKHGRQIVAFADSFESIVMLGRWYARVNRIARKYKPRHQNVPANIRVNGNHNHGNSGESAQGATGGIVNPQFGIFNPGGS